MEHLMPLDEVFRVFPPQTKEILHICGFACLVFLVWGICLLDWFLKVMYANYITAVHGATESDTTGQLNNHSMPTTVLEKLLHMIKRWLMKGEEVYIC